jgi:broad specificity phosphatase PhoE
MGLARLVFVRHGETLSNLQGVAQGWSDSALSPRGERQVRALARRLREWAPTALFSSTLPRAVATAEAISGELSLAPTLLDDLREMNCGEWEGSSFDAVRKNSPEFYARWAANPQLACPGGESFADVRARMESALARISSALNGADETAVVVSHGTAIRIVATALLEIPLATARRLGQGNAAVNVFERRGSRWLLMLWNDTTHCEADG